MNALTLFPFLVPLSFFLPLTVANLLFLISSLSLTLSLSVSLTHKSHYKVLFEKCSLIFYCCCLPRENSSGKCVPHRISAGEQLSIVVLLLSSCCPRLIATADDNQFMERRRRRKRKWRTNCYQRRIRNLSKNRIKFKENRKSLIEKVV